MITLRSVQAYWRARTIRFQLATIIALVCIFLVVLNAAVLGVFFNQYVADRDGNALAQDAAALSDCSSTQIAVDMFQNRRPAADNLLRTVLGSTKTRHAVLVDSTGIVRYVTPMQQALRETLLARLRHDLFLRRLTVSGIPPWHTLSNQIIVDISLICGSGSTPEAAVTPAAVSGGLLLAEDRQVAESAWQRLLGYVFIAGLIAMALAILAGVAAGERMTLAIRAVTRAARAIAAGDVNRRVAPQGPAEITEMSEAFNRMVGEVVRQRRVERDLLANISHELASPLGLIRGYAEALADGVIALEERVPALRAIVLETARLQRLTADLLDLGLLETGQVSLHVEEVPVAELLTGLRDRLAPLMREAGLTSSVEVPEHLAPILTDGQRLEQVLVNLLNNAVRYTRAGGTIFMTAAQDDRGLVVTVRDTGIGIPPEDLPRVWERFYQVEKGRDRREEEAGVGLGLAIARSTVTLLQGTIEVESTPGAGTTFTIRLPARLERPAEQREASRM